MPKKKDGSDFFVFEQINSDPGCFRCAAVLIELIFGSHRIAVMPGFMGGNKPIKTILGSSAAAWVHNIIILPKRRIRPRPLGRPAGFLMI